MAERFSRFRDPGTGIQVFLPPVPPSAQASPLAAILLPLRLAVGILRIALLLVVTLLWSLLSVTLGNVSHAVLGRIHAFFGRAFLFVIGFAWISSEVVSLRSRGRATSAQAHSHFDPRKGDLILCNWSSWIDVVLLLSAFNPTFVHPVVSRAETQAQDQQQSPAANRRKGAAARGQQHAQLSTAPSQAGTSGSGEERILGWKAVGFSKMVMQSGRCPPGSSSSAGLQTLDEVLQSSPGPVVLFPELVTSNNRGLLRFESILPHSWRSLYRATGALRIGKGQANLFVMSIKHDTPTNSSPSTTFSVPATALWSSPLLHLLRLCFASSTYGLHVRMLAEDESPTHAAFAADASAAQRTNALSDKCADLMSSLSRLRRTDLGWQDKEVFLAMYRKRA